MKTTGIVLFFSLLLGSAAGWAARSEGADGEAAGPRRTPVVQAVQKVLPSVVNIATQEILRVSDPFEPFFNEFFESPVRYFKQWIPLGSGVIVEPTGLVLTNHHVIRRASNIQVRLSDGTMYRASLVAVNTTNDLALLHLDGMPGETLLPAIRAAAPGDLLLGETVVAVGNPFGLENSVTTGVLSARNRVLREGTVVFDDILQTDAAINPGNSGGPLINLDGDLIGLNLAIRQGAEGIGFAIPLQRIEEVLAGWLLPSRFSNAVCGFRPETFVDAAGLQARVAEVYAGSPAAAVGLQVGDQIIAINDRPVERALDVGKVLWKLRAGEVAEIRRNDGSVVNITLREMNQDEIIRHRLGIQVQALTPALQNALGLPKTLFGLAISEVLPEGGLASAEVQRGDILYKINDTPIQDGEELAKLLRQAIPGQAADLYLVTSRTFQGELFLKQFRVRVIIQ
jgi:serine protease Do